MIAVVVFFHWLCVVDHNTEENLSCGHCTRAHSRVDLSRGAKRHEQEVPLQRHTRLLRLIHEDAEIHLGESVIIIIMIRNLYAESGQTLQRSFSAVSKPNFARKYALESSRRDLHNALLCTVLKAQLL